MPVSGRTVVTLRAAPIFSSLPLAASSNASAKDLARCGVGVGLVLATAAKGDEEWRRREAGTGFRIRDEVRYEGIRRDTLAEAQDNHNEQPVRNLNWEETWTWIKRHHG
jgi:hypothetical protein